MARHNDTTKAIDFNIGKLVHEERVAQGLSRVQLAEQIGVTHQQLAKNEKGENRISIGRYFQICHALGKPTDYFFKTIASKDFAESPKKRLMIEFTRELVKIKDTALLDDLMRVVRSISRATNRGI